jgi:hypothetical protein
VTTLDTAGRDLRTQFVNAAGKRLTQREFIGLLDSAREALSRSNQPQQLLAKVSHSFEAFKGAGADDVSLWVIPKDGLADPNIPGLFSNDTRVRGTEAIDAAVANLSAVADLRAKELARR